MRNDLLQRLFRICNQVSFAVSAGTSSSKRSKIAFLIKSTLANSLPFALRISKIKGVTKNEGKHNPT